jgi:hypothetical protein
MSEIGSKAIRVVTCLLLHRHYHAVARELDYPRPLDVSDLHAPIVVVSISVWNKTANKALRCA